MTLPSVISSQHHNKNRRTFFLWMFLWYLSCACLLSGCANCGSLQPEGFHRGHHHCRPGDESVCLHMLECYVCVCICVKYATRFTRFVSSDFEVWSYKLSMIVSVAFTAFQFAFNQEVTCCISQLS